MIASIFVHHLMTLVSRMGKIVRHIRIKSHPCPFKCPSRSRITVTISDFTVPASGSVAILQRYRLRDSEGMESVPESGSIFFFYFDLKRVKLWHLSKVESLENGPVFE